MKLVLLTFGVMVLLLAGCASHLTYGPNGQLVAD